MSGAPSTPRWAFVWLWVVTMAAMGLRWRGLDSSLPVATEPDCKIPLQVELIEFGVPDPQANVEFQYYPTLLAQIALALPRAPRLAQDAPLAAHLEAAGRTVFKSRLAVSLVAVLAVPLTFVLTRLYAGPLAALLAAALQATSLLAVSFSQQARPHAASGATFLAALLASVYLHRRGGWRGYFVAGLGLFLAIGTLQSGALCALAPLTAHLLRARQAARGARLRQLFDPRALLVPLLALASVYVFYPFLWDEVTGDRELGRAGTTLELGGHLIFWNQFNGQGIKIVLRTLWFYDPLLLAAAGAALVFAAYRTLRAPLRTLTAMQPATLVLLAFVVPYAGMVLMYERTYERFVLPLIPFLACIAALAIMRAAHIFPRLYWLGAGLALTMVLSTGAFAYKLGSVRQAPSTHYQAAAWIESNVSPGPADRAPNAHAEAEKPYAPTRIALFAPTLDLPLWRNQEGLFEGGRSVIGHLNLWWSRYQARLDGGQGPPPRYPLVWIPGDLAALVSDPERLVAELGAELAVVEVFADNRVHPGATLLRSMLMDKATRLARFSPDGDPYFSQHPLGYQDESSVTPPHFLARILNARCMGPVLEVYDVRALSSGGSAGDK